MKKSFYNFVFHQNNGKHILYNSRTGAMAELDDEHVEQLERWSEQEIEEKNPEFASALVQNGFAIADDVSELDMIRYDSLRARYGNRNLALTIIPTQDCNFRCTYCYEKNTMQRLYMDEETQDALINFIKENLVPEGQLFITWYGGEPLMALDTILMLSKRMLEICEEKNVAYEADIITNGYLLTPDIAEKLLACNIKHFQITLDGNKETHDCRRFLQDGRPTYEIIWKHLLELKKYKEDLTVDLRVNIDKNNRGALETTAKEVYSQGLEGFVSVYPGKVRAVGQCYTRETCYENKEFALIEQDFFCNVSPHLAKKYPKPRNNSCGADNASALVIDADGSLYKCWMDVGNVEDAVGNIRNNEFGNEKLLYEYMLFEPTREKRCGKCKFLPICQGGCAHERLHGQKVCTMFQDIFNKYMEHLPGVIESNKN